MVGVTAKAYNSDDKPMSNEAPVARAVHESIDAIAAPDIRARILHRALHMAREHEIPEAGKSLETFVERHLRAATAFHLGEEAAETVLRSLAPILRLAKTLGADGSKPVSREHPTTRKVSRGEFNTSVDNMDPELTIEHDDGTKQYPTLRPNRSTLPMVLISSSSALRCQEISENLNDTATIQQITDAVSFLDNVQATASLNPIIVFDCVEPSIRTTTLATLAAELPEDSSVLLWGASDQNHNELISLSKAGQGWLRCGPEAKATDVAALVLMLIGE